MASSPTFHAYHTDFLPLPTDAETVSYPVKSWKKANALEQEPCDSYIHVYQESTSIKVVSAINRRYSN